MGHCPIKELAYKSSFIDSKLQNNEFIPNDYRGER